MTPRLDGDDPRHDLPAAEKDSLEKRLRRDARDAVSRDRQRLLRQAQEISRRKSRRAHQGTD